MTYISQQNCSNEPLGSSETFTGVGELSFLPDVMVCVATDADCTLYIDFSIDEGTNYDSTLTFEVNAGTHEFHTGVKGARVCRIRLVNGTSAQSFLRLHTEFGTFRQGNLPLSSTISPDADATIVRTVSPDIDLTLGRVSGMQTDTKFGFVSLVDAADSGKDVWDWASDDLSGASTKTFPTSAATLYAASDAIADTNVQCEAEVILSDGSRSYVTFTTNASSGHTPVSLGVAGLDVNRVSVVGNNQSLTGNLYVQQGNGFTSGVPNSAAAVLAFIRVGQGQTDQALYTVPAGKTMIIKSVVWAVARASGAAGSAVCQIKIKPQGKSWLVKRHYFLSDGLYYKPVSGLVATAGSKVVMHVQDVSDTDTNITGELQFDLVDV